MSVTRVVAEQEAGVEAAGSDNACPGRSPGGWFCCLPVGHDSNHIGTTEDFGTLYQWEQEAVR